MHTNSSVGWCWCRERRLTYGEAPEDIEDVQLVDLVWITLKNKNVTPTLGIYWLAPWGQARSLTTDEAEERGGKEAQKRNIRSKNAVLGAFQVTCFCTACNFIVARIYIASRLNVCCLFRWLSFCRSRRMKGRNRPATSSFRSAARSNDWQNLFLRKNGNDAVTLLSEKHPRFSRCSQAPINDSY